MGRDENIAVFEDAKNSILRSHRAYHLLYKSYLSPHFIPLSNSYDNNFKPQKRINDARSLTLMFVLLHYLL